MPPRVWLVIPLAVLSAGDVALTLHGQPPTYAAGDYGSAVEANPLARPLLARGPLVFVAVAAAGVAVAAAVVLTARRSRAVWVAVIFTLGHAVGGAAWLARLDTLLAAGYVLAAAVVCRTCWNRAGLR